jgi:hypothetical protein
VAEGADVTLQFGMYDYLGCSICLTGWSNHDTGVTYRIDYSPDPTSIDWRQVSTGAVARVQFQIPNNDPRVAALTIPVAGVQVFLPGVQQSQSGQYRVFWCDSTGCFDGRPYALVVHRAPPTISTQPGGQTVQVGETASFTVPPGPPTPRRRSRWPIQRPSTAPGPPTRWGASPATARC